MDITHATIFDGNIDNNLWPEIILAITQVKNVRINSSFEDKNPYKVYFNKTSEISHLHNLGFIVYVLIYEEEQNLKFKKFKAQTLKDTLVKYDG